MTEAAGARYRRFVAIGDSTVEGLDDPDGAGGYRGWANRLAEHLALVQGEVLYANLGVRGRKTRDVIEQQLGPALAMKPDLVAFVSGTNDALRVRFNAADFERDIETAHAQVTAAGAVVLTFTLPDISSLAPLARIASGRIAAMNEALRRACQRTGARLVDFAAIPGATDSRLWSEDRLHANARGHAMIAGAFAEAAGLPGASDEWRQPLPAKPVVSRVETWKTEWRWIRDYFLPWLLRHARGQSSGDGLGPKRPALTPMHRA